MKFSRRNFIASISAAGVASSVAAGFYVKKKISPAEPKDPEVEPEPEVLAPTLDESLLTQRLVGIWSFRWLSTPFEEFPQNEELLLLLDVGAHGRALRGYLGKPPFGDNIFQDRGFQLFSELKADKWPTLRWKMIDEKGAAFECTAIFDEIWDGWETGGGAVTISGSVQKTGAQSGFSIPHAKFIATRQPWTEARQRLSFVPEFHAVLISPHYRLFHQLWHAVRDKWHTLREDRRDDLRALDWQPGIANDERDARGKLRHRNGSGEDFLFMHRHMLRHARSFQNFPAWKSVPLPRPVLDHNRTAFIDYLKNADGFSVPPAWQVSDDTDFTTWLNNVKSSDGYFSNFQLWEAQYQNPDYLSTLCLGELGSRIELGLHDWLHMRWASICRDPNSGRPMVEDRNPIDFSEHWFRAENDYLADPFSSHVNPVFWYFHGWIDDRIEDWFFAHERAHPGEVVRKTVNGVPWFAPGKWVRIAEPWLGPAQAGCGAWMRNNGAGNYQAANSQYDIETMKLALRIVFSEKDEAARLHKRVPRRPWYGRYLPRGA